MYERVFKGGVLCGVLGLGHASELRLSVKLLMKGLGLYFFHSACFFVETWVLLETACSVLYSIVSGTGFGKCNFEVTVTRPV